MRVLAVGAMAVVLVLALAGCETDNRRCLHSHTDLIPITTVNAQGQPSISWMYVDTCDKYEEPTP